MTGRVLITGASGFIGGHLVAALAPAGVPLRLMSTGRVDAGGPSDIEQITVPDWSHVDLGTALEGIDTVIHLAGLSVRPTEDATARFTSANAELTDRLVTAAGHAGTRRFIHLSSVHAVSPSASDALVDDRTEPAPASAYGRSKRAAEQSVARFERFGISLRPPLVIGHGARGNFARLQQLAARRLPLPLASIAARRSYLSVETLVAALVHLAWADPAPTRSGGYALCDTRPMALPEIVTALRRGMGRAPGLFAFPPTLLAAGARAIGGEGLAGRLCGPLVIDDSRFRERFAFSTTTDMAASIEALARR
ncbi:NAD-dependent epimerase/dehydratase family protein [Pelagibacterium montanilacus]|uniref:NAD-dependent epimerase/dehydratase family protein n=1 Tax=Pelagibacterium montanilacus TaxID=2185280 RepID=UPI000F8F6836|nr:NAD-dependent epimerase/dehydratase family protein [Pelagibacterium montanilacus]